MCRVGDVLSLAVTVEVNEGDVLPQSYPYGSLVLGFAEAQLGKCVLQDGPQHGHVSCGILGLHVNLRLGHDEVAARRSDHEVGLIGPR